MMEYPLIWKETFTAVVESIAIVESSDSTRTLYRTCNPASHIQDEDDFRRDTRFDVVYQLLRHGPIFRSIHTKEGQENPYRYKRKRVYYQRKVKKYPKNELTITTTEQE